MSTPGPIFIFTLNLGTRATIIMYDDQVASLQCSGSCCSAVLPRSVGAGRVKENKN